MDRSDYIKILKGLEWNSTLLSLMLDEEIKRKAEEKEPAKKIPLKIINDKKEK